MLTIQRHAAIFGFGYEGCELGEFIAQLGREGITLLVDVRLNPISRKRGFSKTALAAALADAGIGYQHMRALGNPKWNRAGFGGDTAELEAARGVYIDQTLGAPAAQEALARIAEAARRETVAIMCFEADERRCHRRLVLGALNDLSDASQPSSGDTRHPGR
ncbi:uncharacterized protein (DUF488 family) [Thermocatellispora tengchongensis]|uniref:Uncharacterized protein (DUF488 family) n=1 Tax=Thermocatellispora tengchongensis TaxID=1073253 RepID=A0A840P573_9ACTN|nr:DUF488 domain-containing protein [Thermocatellispora tengchongensis]MBB5132630.1 uncharacterized protein (DUF488 family) [Thermocatellispora tengchongensis]